MSVRALLGAAGFYFFDYLLNFVLSHCLLNTFNLYIIKTFITVNVRFFSPLLSNIIHLFIIEIFVAFREKLLSS